MAFGSFHPHRPQSMMSDINVTPMVDVMLVLLVVFILTAPLLTPTIALELPRAAAAASPQPAATVNLSVNAAGAWFWDGAPVDAAGLDARLAAAARRDPQPELALRADKNTRYEVVAQLMAAARTHGLGKLGFVTDPGNGGGAEHGVNHGAEDHHGQR